MSVLIPKSASFFFSSDSANQAQNVSADGSQFTVVLNSPLALPKGAMAATLSVSQANIWNTSYNISAAFGNNVFRFRSANNEHTIIFPWWALFSEWVQFVSVDAVCKFGAFVKSAQRGRWWCNTESNYYFHKCWRPSWFYCGEQCKRDFRLQCKSSSGDHRGVQCIQRRARKF